MAAQRGNCPVCGREYRLTGANLLPRHWARDENGRAAEGLPSCRGAGTDPTHRAQALTTTKGHPDGH